MEQHAQFIAEQKEEMVQLQQWIEKGHAYLDLGKEVNALHAENEQLHEQNESLQSKINSRVRAVEHIQTRLEAAQQRANAMKVESASLQGQEVYAAVRDASPMRTEHSLEWLKNERADLHLKLNRISQGRQQLQEKRDQAKKTKASLDKEMNKLRQEQSDLNLDEGLEFPSSTGEEQMEELLQEQRAQEERFQRAKAEYRLIEKDFLALQVTVKHLKERYEEDHAPHKPLVFFEELHAVQEQVRAEDDQLQAEQQGLQQLQQQIHTQLGKIEEALQYLAPYTIMHGFENPQIQAQSLTKEEQADFLYERLSIVKRVMAKLLLHNEAWLAEEKTVKKAKAQFIDFCRKHIKDVKTRETTEQGIEQRESYEEVAAFQQTMNNRIERVNHIAEESMRTHNQQLEQFIVYVHSHLKLIASELRDIPNKTKVKVEDQWKFIYSFQIPEWDELEAKASIRNHVEWILGELDKRSIVMTAVRSLQQRSVKRWRSGWIRSKCSRL